MDGVLGNAVNVLDTGRNQGFFCLAEEMKRDLFNVNGERGKGT